MQNQASEIQSANSSEHKHQMFWDDLNNLTTTQRTESYSNKFKRMILKYKLESSDFIETFSDGKTILENIAENGHSDMIRFLFDRYDNIDIDKKYIEGNTLLHIAVKKENFEMAKFLIEKGARIEIINDHSQIPLTLCPAENNEIKKLLQDTQNLDSNLHQAIRDNNEEKIKELLQSGARPNGGITKVEDEAVTKGNVKIGKFVSNIRLAIESDSSDGIIGLLMNKYVKTTSNPLEIACSSDKKNLFEYLCHDDYHHFFEKNIPNLLNKSIQHGSVNMVKYLLNDYDINYKYENEFNNNALQVAISNQFHFKTDDEKVRGKEIINLLIDKIIEKYPQHEEALSSKNKNGHDARFMLNHIGEIGKDLLNTINIKIEKKRVEDERIKRQKEYEDKTQKLIQELEEEQGNSNPSCMTALCCCMNVNIVERVDVVGNSQGVKADIVFEEKKLATPAEEPKTLQDKTPKEQQPIAEEIEVKAPSNTNSMQKTIEESRVRSDSPVDTPDSVKITLTSTPVVTPKPSQSGGMPRAMEPAVSSSVR